MKFHYRNLRMPSRSDWETSYVTRITLEVYTQAVTSNKRAAQSKVVRMMIPGVGQNADEMDPQKARVGA